MKAPTLMVVARHSGTEFSNPFPSSGESGTNSSSTRDRTHRDKAGRNVFRDELMIEQIQARNAAELERQTHGATPSRSRMSHGWLRLRSSGVLMPIAAKGRQRPTNR
jgi:hypothetical protein